MKNAKKLGIWMDHSRAHLMEYSSENALTTTIESPYTQDVKGEMMGRNEHVMHQKEQHLQADYYKNLGFLIKEYDEVLLFGPTDAKLELHNMLKTDHHFDHVKIEVKPTDKMTENQQMAFVAAHFGK